MTKNVNGTVTVPAGEPQDSGFYTDLELRLYFVTGATETLEDTQPVSTSKTYIFTFEDEGFQPKVKLVRISTDEVLTDTATRGVLPRSFLVPKTDSLYFTDFITSNFTFDAGLAVTAVTGARWYDLAREITHGLSMSVVTGATIPFKVNHVVPEGDAFYRTSSVAIIAYSLGYYLEKRGLKASNKQEVANTLYKLLGWLMSKRSAEHGGLLTAGNGKYEGSVLDEDFVDDYAATIDNILAYFAFKQAGLILNEIFASVADTLKASINTKLWNSSTDRFYHGIYPTGQSIADDLETNLYGAYFLVDDNDVGGAEHILDWVEANYKVIDVTNNVSGYKAKTTDTSVWFEGSYMAALAHYKVDNTSKYRTTITDLNKLQNEDDGSFQYGIVKDGKYNVLTYKSVGSTAWSYMLNQMPNEVFAFRDIDILPGLDEVYFNNPVSDYIQRDNCLPTEEGQTVLYTVAAGAFSSTISQDDADEQALDFFEDTKQDYANAHAICVVTGTTMYGNEEKSMYFRKNCGAGEVGSFELFTVYADTFFSDISVEDANHTRDLYIMLTGPGFANGLGYCFPATHEVLVEPQLYVTNNGIEDQVFLNFLAAEAVETNIIIEYNYSIDGGTTWITPTGATPTMLTGSVTTYSTLLASTLTGTGGSVMVQITGIGPGSFGSQIYIYPGLDMGELYFNEERSLMFDRNNCLFGEGSIVTYTIPESTYTSYFSVEDANAKADLDIATNGQAYANSHGTCSVPEIFYNTTKSETFVKNDCPSGYSGSSVVYTVPAGTYQSSLGVGAANALALADVATNGQAYANAHGTCTSPYTDITIGIYTSFESVGAKTFVYARAVASQSVTTNISVAFNMTYNGTSGLGSTLIIPTGQTQSDEEMIKMMPTSEVDTATFEFNIYLVTPGNHGGFNYIGIG